MAKRQSFSKSLLPAALLTHCDKTGSRSANCKRAGLTCIARCTNERVSSFQGFCGVVEVLVLEAKLAGCSLIALRVNDSRERKVRQIDSVRGTGEAT